MSKLAAVFPGQGSQYVGMAKSLYEENGEVRELFNKAEQVLGFDLYKLCSAGPENELKKTENTQPALLAASVAAFQIYQKRGGVQPDFGAGHSLGEITALCCSGAIRFEDALRLVRLRGRLMQEAAPEGTGAMFAVRGADVRVIEKICESISREAHIAVVSNYNAPDQTVISGHAEAVEEAGSLLQKEGGSVIPLKVSAPFHSPLMKACADKLKNELEGIIYHDFRFPVISNVTGKPYQKKEQIAGFLYEQITSSVLWRDTMSYLQINGVDTVIEFGPKTVLKDLAIKNVPLIRAYSYENDVQMVQRIIDSRGKEQTNTGSNILGRCLAAAVSTKNNISDEDVYQEGVVKPYRELAKLEALVKENGNLANGEDLKKGLEYLTKILETKQVPLEEQHDIISDIRKGMVS